MSTEGVKQCSQDRRVLRFVVIYSADVEHVERASGPALEIIVLLCDDVDFCKESRQLRIDSALLQIVENRFAPRRPTLIQRGILGSPAAGWAPRRCQVA